MGNQQSEEKKEDRAIAIDLGETSDLSLPSTKSLSETLASAADFNNRISEMLRPTVEAISKIMVNNDYFSGIQETLNSFAKRITELYTFDFSPIMESMRGFTERLSEMLKDIRIPEISEERKQELIESHRQWGEYGWTINPCADIETLYDSVPNSKKEADLAAMKYCSNKYMPSIFDEIRKCKRVKKSDFEEAVFTFDSSKYKSCAMILLSLIDAHLIRFQRKSDLDAKHPRREVGLGAVNKAKARAEDNLSESMLFTAMFYANLFSCLSKVFEGGKDFKTQPQVINRNFLDHGMLTRRVTRKDCIQLFLLYYNMLNLLDMVY